MEVGVQGVMGGRGEFSQSLTPAGWSVGGSGELGCAGQVVFFLLLLFFWMMRLKLQQCAFIQLEEASVAEQQQGGGGYGGGREGE